ncbi:hypothetical protein EYF80_068227 [Liparis tanakae]|uniref:Uncharacterized protein n=1 Tax=Liparis tanakae TaxID=230148 RepID=A0A4Z2DYN3_9TELE|nr:hypothetical protein EYF80_068227 [Liparis tanakae]
MSSRPPGRLKPSVGPNLRVGAPGVTGSEIVSEEQQEALEASSSSGTLEEEEEGEEEEEEEEEEQESAAVGEPGPLGLRISPRQPGARPRGPGAPHCSMEAV